MGRGIVETGLGRTERLELQVRTTDPGTTHEGEAWIRSDVAPKTDQIATLRVDHGSGTWDIPIFDSAASAGQNVTPALRVRVGGVTGFVPATDDSPTFNAVRLQHDGSQYAAHDALTASAIPDSVVDNFEDNGLTEYTTFAGNFETRTSDVVEGTYGFGNSSNAGSITLIHSLEGNGLDYYPQKGDKFSCLMLDPTGTENNLPIVMFGLFNDSGTIRGYGANHYPSNDEINIVEVADNSFTILQTGTPSISKGTWYDYEVEWHDGSGSEADNEIVLTVYEVNTGADLSTELGRTSTVASIQVNDSQYPSGRGIGFGNFTGAQQAGTTSDRYWHLGSVE